MKSEAARFGLRCAGVLTGCCRRRFSAGGVTAKLRLLPPPPLDWAEAAESAVPQRPSSVTHESPPPECEPVAELRLPADEERSLGDAPSRMVAARLLNGEPIAPFHPTSRPPPLPPLPNCGVSTPPIA
eukprot:SAG11_NODE_2290_length_3558_cov_2.262215_3_plen_128_part_00